MSSDQWWQTDKNDSVATKRELWQPIADEIGGFDLDPAAGCEPTPIATDRYTESDDGLSKSWYGTVWLNPPFSDKKTWFKRLVDQYKNGDVNRAVALSTTGTSATWFQKWFGTADLIVFLEGRDWYVHGGNKPNYCTQVGVWNPTQELRTYLHTIGTVVEPVDDPNQSELPL